LDSFFSTPFKKNTVLKYHSLVVGFSVLTNVLFIMNLDNGIAETQPSFE